MTLARQNARSRSKTAEAGPVACKVVATTSQAPSTDTTGILQVLLLSEIYRDQRRSAANWTYIDPFEGCLGRPGRA